MTNSLFKYNTFQKTIINGIVTKVGLLKTVGDLNTPYIDFTIKTINYYAPKNDKTNIKQFTKWHNCQAYGRMAEYIENQNINVGDLLYVEGSFDYNRMADISSAINQYVTVNISHFTLLLREAEKNTEQTISPQFDDEAIETLNSSIEFEFEPINNAKGVENA